MAKATALGHNRHYLNDFEEKFGPLAEWPEDRITPWGQGTNFSIIHHQDGEVRLYKINGDEIGDYYKHNSYGIFLSSEMIEKLKEIFKQAPVEIIFYMVNINESSEITKSPLPYGIYVIGIQTEDCFDYNHMLSKEYKDLLEQLSQQYPVLRAQLPVIDKEILLRDYGSLVCLTDQGPYTVIVEGSNLDKMSSIVSSNNISGYPMSIYQIWLDFYIREDQDSLNFLENYSSSKRKKLIEEKIKPNMEFLKKIISDILTPGTRLHYKKNEDEPEFYWQKNATNWKKFFGLIKKFGEGALKDKRSSIQISRLLGIDNLSSKINKI